MLLKETKMTSALIAVFVVGAALSFYASHKSKVDATKKKLDELFD
jgi:hypothetical protein